jgi:hypothetical protein
MFADHGEETNVKTEESEQDDENLIYNKLSASQ